MKVNNNLLIALMVSIALVLAVYIYSNNTPFKQCLDAGAQNKGEKSFEDMARSSSKNQIYNLCRRDVQN